ncbi:hypothetical protein NQ315_008443 [Exocentrus adspersus]|uniref:60S ribosomal export protein NMD3 n=1 Tax=Exocentrus adspersus TaxID=1586481 RepID=A0AAV8W5A1_9CUCU|nr:hypothetical protein NQ315_008443 [Exocentrus adspersus]
MEYLQEGPPSDALKSKILCCECGTEIEPNPANMCVACLRTHVDITEGIPKQGTLYFCRGCERYHNPPSEWVHCALESRELLSLCLKKLKGLNRVKLVDAGFVWTEPHSKRIKASTLASILGAGTKQVLPVFCEFRFLTNKIGFFLVFIKNVNILGLKIEMGTDIAYSLLCKL